MRRFAIVLVVIGLAPAVHAQRGGPGVFVRVGVETDVVKGAPYSADVVTESVQVLSDGNRIVHRSSLAIRLPETRGRLMSTLELPVRVRRCRSSTAGSSTEAASSSGSTS